MEYLTVKDFFNGKGFASYQLRDNIKELKLQDNDIILSLAYTDYGGSFLDRVFIEFFIEKYPNNILWENTCYYGKNAIIYGGIVKDIQKENENYLLGFQDIEDFYFQKERECQEEQTTSFLNEYRNAKGEELSEKEKQDCFNIICDKLSEYSILSSGDIDVCEDTLIETLEEFIIGGVYAKGMQKLNKRMSVV